MEQYFDIRYEFDVPTVHATIDKHVTGKQGGYICVADGNILTMVHNDKEYRDVVNGSIFSICDSSWVPKFVKWIYGHERNHYCGSDIFIDIIRSRKYRMIFLGTKQNVLDALQQNLAKENPDVAGMTFRELPFCSVDEFDYESIADTIEQDGAEIIWVALGAPKQEFWMEKNGAATGAHLLCGLGGSLDVFAGTVERAPQFFRDHGLEWFYRLCKEPKRIGRMMKLPLFLIHVKKEKKR